MSEDLEQEAQELRERLNKALRERAALYQKSKQLQERVRDQREREHTQDDVARELLERQRELNFMLNRANIMLSRAQEANALLSLEFTEIVKALPEPKGKEVRERIDKINELFKKTGASAAADESPAGGSPEPPTPPPPHFREAEIMEEPQRAEKEQNVCQTVTDEPATEAKESPDECVVAEPVEAEQVIISPEAELVPPESFEEDLAFPPRRRPWWRFGT